MTIIGDEILVKFLKATTLLDVTQIKIRLHWLDANISPGRSSLTPQAFIGIFVGSIL